MAEVKSVALEYFGEFIARELRDRAIEHFDGLAKNRWKAPALRQLQADLSELSEKQLEASRRAFVSSLDAGIHDFLFKLQETADFENRLQLIVDGQNIVHESDGLQGEIFGPEGWFSRFSRFGAPPDSP